jgi:hypothetical protein
MGGRHLPPASRILRRGCQAHGSAVALGFSVLLRRPESYPEDNGVVVFPTFLNTFMTFVT